MEKYNQKFIIGYEEKDGYIEVYYDDGDVTVLSSDFKKDIIKRMNMQKELFPDYFTNITAKIKIDEFLKSIGILSSGVLTILSIDTFFYARFSSIMALFLAAMLTKCYEFASIDKKKNILYRKFSYYLENIDIFARASLDDKTLFKGLNFKTFKTIEEYLQINGTFDLNLVRKLRLLDLIKIVKNYQNNLKDKAKSYLLYKENKNGN